MSTDVPTDVSDGSAAGLPAGHAFEAFDMRVVEVEGADWAMEMDVTPRVVNSSGVLQGGLMATLVDMVAGVALLRGEAPYERGSTSELQISYLDEDPATVGERLSPVVGRLWSTASSRLVLAAPFESVVTVDLERFGPPAD